jgi:Co/Zn/Cd efflux system component
MERRVLVQLLAINAAFFVIELVSGWWADSSGLLADAMDMFADAAVYGVALHAVGRPAERQRRAAHLAGILQFILALWVLARTLYHAMAGIVPEGGAMVAVSLLALAANVACLRIIARQRHVGAHMQASYIFSASDVLANLGVIAAGLVVAGSGRPWPDWVIGAAIGLVVLAGAIRILRLR